MKEKTAFVEDSFSLSGFGIIAELKHFENGLKQNTELISKNSGQKWNVVAHVLFSHVSEQQVKFNEENSQFIHPRFENHEKALESINKIIQKERRGIFQYFISPINHMDKPMVGDYLFVKSQ